MQSWKNALRATALVIAAGAVATPRAEAQQDTTEVVVLGVAHSAMLVAQSYQPAVFRAFFERVDPDALCIERAPEEFARGSHYEFTYEIQHIAVPWAREQGVALCPFDWLPAAEDQLLAFGVNVSEPPFLRGPRSYSSFLSYDDSASLAFDLFSAEAETSRAEFRDWYMEMAPRPRHDFARRMFLYRTFLQAMRIARAAQQHPGGRVLVVVGAMHKDDIERILADQPGVRVVSPTAFGAPSAAEIEANVLREDLFAVATFNLLGAQAVAGNIDWAWIEGVLDRLAGDRADAEVDLLRTRYAVLHEGLSAVDAATRYRAIAARADARVRFNWDGVLDRRRLDSFFDPFGNLTVAQRAALEEARELLRAGRPHDGEARLATLSAELTPLQAAQLAAYRADWLEID